ncbi:MAG: type II toxin-antitoxin system HicB family antitoxin [Nitrospiraceae bacterium]
MKYRIALHKSEEGYAVSVPGLPGCWSQGATEQEAIQNIQDAIREYLTVVEDEIRGSNKWGRDSMFGARRAAKSQ